MRHEFIGLLRSRVETDGVVDVVVHRERSACIGAVDRTAGRIDEVLYTSVATGFQYIDETHEIGRDIGMGVFERITDSRLGGEVHHTLGLVFRESPRKRISIFDIEAQISKLRMILQPRKA